MILESSFYLIEKHTDSVDLQWGGNQMIRTTADSFERLLKDGVPLEQLPKTLQDAVTIVRALGLSYLWIDSLCIIQDSRVDFEYEAFNIKRIFQNATFAISAAAGSDPNGGIFRPRQEPLLRLEFFQPASPIKPADRHAQGSEPTLRLQEHGNWALSIRRPLQTVAEALMSNVLRKAWMIQETVLPTRLLIWGDEQVYWNCHTCLRSEGNNLTQKPFLKLVPRLDIESASVPSTTKCFNQWYKLLEIYCPAALSFERDRLNALSGMAEYFNPQGDYIAGLWADDIKRGLLFIGSAPTAGTPATSYPVYVAPSWSPLAIQRPAKYCLLPGIRDDLLPSDKSMTLLDAVCTLRTYGSNPYREIKSASMRVRAMSRDARCNSGIENCEYFFDMMNDEQLWCSGEEFVLMLVTLWSPCRPTSPDHSQLLGLVLSRQSKKDQRSGRGEDDDNDDDNDEECFSRVGVFLGSKYDPEMGGCEQSDLCII
jgi:hypothetical protein